MSNSTTWRRYLRIFFEKIFRPNREGIEHYSKVISPEVLNDDFYRLLSDLARREDVLTFLEIGSSSGEGSTSALANGIRERPSTAGVQLHCMEISEPRFELLLEAYNQVDFMHVHRLSSVGLDHFPTKRELKYFYRNFQSSLNLYTFDEIFSWLVKDLEYLKAHSEILLPGGSTGIESIKNKFKIHSFDFVLIDGGEFVGYSEFKILKGAKIICLDDVNSYKCRYAYDDLASDSNYRLIAENWKTRNGWAVFELSTSN
jgi:hypothetical protein